MMSATETEVEVPASSCLAVLSDDNTLQLILDFLQSYQDLSVLSCVNRQWKQACRNHPAWGTLSSSQLWNEVQTKPESGEMQEHDAARLETALASVCRSHGAAMHCIKLVSPAISRLEDRLARIALDPESEEAFATDPDMEDVQRRMDSVVLSVLPMLSSVTVSSLAELHVEVTASKSTAHVVERLRELPGLKKLTVMGPWSALKHQLRQHLPPRSGTPAAGSSSASIVSFEGAGPGTLVSLRELNLKGVRLDDLRDTWEVPILPVIMATLVGVPTAAAVAGQPATAAAATAALGAVAGAAVMPAVLPAQGADDVAAGGPPAPAAGPADAAATAAGAAPYTAAATTAKPWLESLSLGWKSEAHSATMDEPPTQHLVLELEGLRALASHGPSLRHLNLSGCVMHCHPNFSRLPQHQTNSQRNAGSANPTTSGPEPITILGALSQLVTLNMSSSSLNMTRPSSVVGMGDWHPAMLQGLNLRNCSWVKNDDLIALLHRCPYLERLNLSACDGPNDQVLELLPVACPRLLLLDVCYCQGMTLNGLLQCCAAYPQHQLTGLGCSGFEQMNDGNLITLVTTQGQNLTLLGVGGCPELTDGSLAMIARHCPKLASLYIDGCKGFTGVALHQLTQACPMLSAISASGCEGLLDEASRQLLRLKPSVFDADQHA